MLISVLSMHVSKAENASSVHGCVGGGGGGETGLLYRGGGGSNRLPGLVTK